MSAQPDIEIYIKDVKLGDICQWLEQKLGAQVQQQTQSKAKLSFEFEGKTIPVKAFTRAAGKNFACVWFDSAHTPWDTDIDCARQAFKDLNTEVRCNAQGWEQEQDPDMWWHITANGEETFLWQQD